MKCLCTELLGFGSFPYTSWPLVPVFPCQLIQVSQQKGMELADWLYDRLPVVFWKGLFSMLKPLVFVESTVTRRAENFRLKDELLMLRSWLRWIGQRMTPCHRDLDKRSGSDHDLF